MITMYWAQSSLHTQFFWNHSFSSILINIKFHSMMSSCVCRSCPSPPNNVVASFSSKPPSCLNNANVSWDPSLTTDIDTYFVECASNFDSFNITVDGNATSAVFGNLTSPMVEYRCTVEAINSAGKSQPAFARPFVTT